jgi:hypothetical protein
MVESCPKSRFVCVPGFLVSPASVVVAVPLVFLCCGLLFQPGQRFGVFLVVPIFESYLENLSAFCCFLYVFAIEFLINFGLIFPVVFMEVVSMD